MTAAGTMSQPPAVPPRPSGSQDRANATDSIPKMPPRLSKRFDRSVSPNYDRFAPSPLNETLLAPKSPRATRLGVNNLADQNSDEPIKRPGSVTMPSLGEEGAEYAAVQDELIAPSSPPPDSASVSSPEQTRTIAQDLHLHAPKPSFPAQTAKKRVQAVTRTDSDKAASFGIGRPSSEELPAIRGSFKKKRSTMSQTSEPESVFDDEEQGIPEIGQRVPMNPDLGDVQAPSPAPHSSSTDGVRSHTPRAHTRKHSARGFSSLPPGSYGLHGHGAPEPTDKLQKAWYEKNPASFKKESARSLHDRQTDYALSSTDLNKLVRETRDFALGTSAAFTGTPTEEVGYQASDEYTQRIASRPGSSQPKSPELRRIESPRRDSPASVPESPNQQDDSEDVIHVDASQDHTAYYSKHAGDDNVADPEDTYNAPILAPDEVAKDPGHYNWQPAVPPERRPSAFDEEDAVRTPSRPISLHRGSSQLELNSTPLEDVEEYEPLFPEDEEVKKKEDAANTWKPRHKFPSKDVWEDAPESVNATAVVSTPELLEEAPKPKIKIGEDRAETPAQAFARRQEALAEKESRESENFLRRTSAPIHHDPIQRLKAQATRPSAPNRFPSRDIWEDAPESSLYQTTVNTPEEASQETEEAREAQETQETDAPAKPQIPARPQRRPTPGEKPALPERPRPRQTPSDERVKPSVTDKPKPQIPARPTRTLPSGVDSKEQDSLPKPKPAIPARPVGSKIQALQAGFMSDLNKRLQLGPQLPTKKDEPPAADMIEEKEKAPLVDARKGRARGPQRRLPASKSPAPAATAAPAALTLSLSAIQTSWSIGDDGTLEVDTTSDSTEAKEASPEKEMAPEVVPEAEPAPEPEVPEPKAAEAISPEAPTEGSEIQPPTAPDEQPEEADDSKPEEVEVEAEAEKPQEDLKTLASNMAGESIVEVKTQEAQDDVKPVAVKETGGEAE
ncbi:hypothetical protein SODALDRAFT_325961 [Sodiomyces alkalinus F11]|uniref:Altered inheritance of mitochondria protein 21 n=1 Tax=Sodiomyces alkalinus (strain CBS 110278 / VKM F-3762 / F11) TaxID=1314773 RepID=A0A3N2PQ71_SODAK|nr:hypothetical protein SODALDRAFT_325961 [Sodiomyces alkalinus F11]ROT36661.1 hypothetical protein SODALDRAFT_325961 [Sodiomyces alkalinus F11]